MCRGWIQEEELEKETLKQQPEKEEENLKEEQCYGNEEEGELWRSVWLSNESQARSEDSTLSFGVMEVLAILARAAAMKRWG
jgi:hypothetical protein